MFIRTRCTRNIIPIHVSISSRQNILTFTKKNEISYAYAITRHEWKALKR